MMTVLKPLALLCAVFTALLTLTGVPARRGNTGVSATATTDGDLLTSLDALHPIDAHVHVFRSAPEFQKMLEDEQLLLLNILVIDDTSTPRKEPQPQIDAAWSLAYRSRGHVKFCTTYNLFKFNSPNFPAKSIRQVNRDFHEGAVAMKIWKNFRMEVKNSQEKYVLPDAPKLQPISTYLEIWELVEIGTRFASEVGCHSSNKKAWKRADSRPDVQLWEALSSWISALIWRRSTKLQGRLTSTASGGFESFLRKLFRLTKHFRAVVVTVELNMAVNRRPHFAAASFRAVSGCRKATPGILSALLCRKSALRQLKAIFEVG
jgi:hypothetical protein